MNEFSLLMSQEKCMVCMDSKDFVTIHCASNGNQNSIRHFCCRNCAIKHYKINPAFPLDRINEEMNCFLCKTTLTFQEKEDFTNQLKCNIFPFQILIFCF